MGPIQHFDRSLGSAYLLASRRHHPFIFWDTEGVLLPLGVRKPVIKARVGLQRCGSSKVDPEFLSPSQCGRQTPRNKTVDPTVKRHKVELGQSTISDQHGLRLPPFSSAFLQCWAFDAMVNFERASRACRTFQDLQEHPVTMYQSYKSNSFRSKGCAVSGYASPWSSGTGILSYGCEESGIAKNAGADGSADHWTDLLMITTGTWWHHFGSTMKALIRHD
ncbi:hypothetical protein POX_b02386 [Penicillium oxalicum]|uniref:hypothetical protein n=1 Tax=Penicillium oxalicum TaxID=69781 RepID=UPI0020B8B9B9|nr:hypothetical protein POX_b02386 [Penicillium oxalicum]KAI2792349.1 hypothetical protein POX_b02386 [Penicillium oxalicum]